MLGHCANNIQNLGDIQRAGCQRLRLDRCRANISGQFKDRLDGLIELFLTFAGRHRRGFGFHRSGHRITRHFIDRLTHLGDCGGGHFDFAVLHHQIGVAVNHQGAHFFRGRRQLVSGIAHLGQGLAQIAAHALHRLQQQGRLISALTVDCARTQVARGNGFRAVQRLTDRHCETFGQTPGKQYGQQHRQKHDPISDDQGVLIHRRRCSAGFCFGVVIDLFQLAQGCFDTFRHGLHLAPDERPSGLCLVLVDQRIDLLGTLDVALICALQPLDERALVILGDERVVGLYGLLEPGLLFKELGVSQSHLRKIMRGKHFGHGGAGFLDRQGNIVTQRNPGKGIVFDFKRLLTNTVQLLNAENTKPEHQHHHQRKAGGGPRGYFQLSQHLQSPSRDR